MSDQTITLPDHHCPHCNRLLATYERPGEAHLAAGVHSAELPGLPVLTVRCPVCANLVAVPDPPMPPAP